MRTPTENRDQDVAALQKELLVGCLIRAGRREEARQQIAKSTPEAITARLRIYEGLLFAYEGEAHEAWERLGSAAEGSRSLARAAAVHAASLAAHRATETGDVLALVKAFELWHDIEPGNKKIGAHLERVRQTIPVMQLLGGRREDALATWRKQQQASNDDLNALHALAVSTWFWAQEADRGGRLQDAENRWKEAIRHWATLLHSTKFWAEWSERRAKATGQAIDRAGLERVRERVTSELVRVLEDRVRTTESNTSAARRASAEHLLLTLEIELEGASLCERAIVGLRARRAASPLKLACGPLMAESLGLGGSIPHLVADARRGILTEEEATALSRIFSPWAAGWILLRKRRHREAAEAMKTALKHREADGAAWEILGEALAGEAEARARAGAYAAALEALREAATSAPAARKHVATVVDKIAADVAKAALREESADLDGSKSILEQLLALCSSDAVKANLAAVHKLKGLQHWNADRYGFAEEAFRSALRHSPEDADLRNWLVAALTQQARSLIERNALEAGEAKLRETLDIGTANPDLRQQVSLGFSNLGVSFANRAAGRWDPDWAKAKPLLQMALRIDPQNQHARHNLSIIG